MLAKFHNYIFGTHVATYNDHKRIQRMHLCFQWYNLTVKYRKGKDVELPDTLSRAQLTENTPAINGLECICMLHFVSVSDQNYTPPHHA